MSSYLVRQQNLCGLFSSRKKGYFKNKARSKVLMKKKKEFIRSFYFPKLFIHTFFFFWPFMDGLAFPAAIRFPPGIKTKPVSHQGRSWLIPAGRLPSRFCLQEDQQVVCRPLRCLLSHISLEIQNGQSCLEGKCQCHLLPLLVHGWLGGAGCCIHDQKCHCRSSSSILLLFGRGKHI